MVASSKFGVDYSYIFNSTRIKDKLPVKTFAGPPPNMYQQQSTGFSAQFNAVDSMVYAYSGAILFVAFMAEMRHPMDFWKGMICAQAFICSVYILFGAYVSLHSLPGPRRRLMPYRSTATTASTPDRTFRRSLSPCICRWWPTCSLY